MTADIAHPATYAHGVPHSSFARMRRQEPVAWTEEPLLERRSVAGRTAHRGSGYWALTRHSTVVEASRQPEIFSSMRQGAFLVDPRSRRDLDQARQLLVNMDAPQHTPIRRLVSGVFTPRAVQGLADGVRRHARTVVAAAVAKDSCDAVADLAAELPLLVLADLLGMDPADRHLLFRWSNHLVGFDDPEYGAGDIDTYRQTMGEAFAYALALADRRRRDPGTDLMSMLAHADVQGRRLTDREFCHLWLLLVVAGNETTRHLIANAVLALVEHPGERHRLVAKPDLVPTAVEELLRWVTPIMQFRRTATRDVRVEDQVIREGDKVVLYYVAANRDPAVFADPNRLDLARDPNPHLAFGIGPHYCLGAALARLEMRALLTELLPHLSRMEITGPPERLSSNFVNGLKALPVRMRGGEGRSMGY